MVATTVVGTSIFATLQEQGVLWLRILLGLLVSLRRFLAALQTFLRLAERSEKHRAAGASFGAIRRELEQAQSLSDEQRPKGIP